MDHAKDTKSEGSHRKTNIHWGKNNQHTRKMEETQTPQDDRSLPSVSLRNDMESYSVAAERKREDSEIYTPIRW